MTIFEIQKDGDTIFDNKENFNSEDVIITNSIVKQKINKKIKLLYIDYDKNMNNFSYKKYYNNSVVEKEKNLRIINDIRSKAMKIKTV